jgi:hypothetical protein
MREAGIGSTRASRLDRQRVGLQAYEAKLGGVRQKGKRRHSYYHRRYATSDRLQPRPIVVYAVISSVIIGAAKMRHIITIGSIPIPPFPFAARPIFILKRRLFVVHWGASAPLGSRRKKDATSSVSCNKGQTSIGLICPSSCAPKIFVWDSSRQLTTNIGRISI